MEQYVLVGEFADQHAANRACSLLEDQSVPVMVEHSERPSELGPELIYRILVPIQLSQRSLVALSGLIPKFGISADPSDSLPYA